MSAITTPARVSTLELFFDLVFVFTITQLTGVLALHPSVRGLLQVAVLLGVIWWMYGGYAWQTNAVELDRLSRRLLLLGGMASYLVLALAIPRAFSGSGTAFGLAYLAIVLVHATLFTRSSSGSVVRGIMRVGPVNVGTALLVVLAGALGGTPEHVLLAVAGITQWLSPHATSLQGFAIGPAHFVERHGLVVLIAIGESVVAVGMGAERALADAPEAARPGLALTSFGYCHLPILLGIVAVAATLREATGHALHELRSAPEARPRCRSRASSPSCSPASPANALPRQAREAARMRSIARA